LLEIEIAVPSGTLVWVAFEKRFVKDVLRPFGNKIQVPSYAEEGIFGKIPVDNVQHVWILVPPVHAAIGFA
jgi:hypothetical protein